MSSNPLNHRTISDVHSGAGRAELSLCVIVLFIRKAVESAATWAQRTNIPLESLQTSVKLETLLSTYTLLQRWEDMEDRPRTGLRKSCPGYSEKRVWSSFSKPQCFLLVWQKTTATVSGWGCRVPCYHQSDKQKQLAFAVKVFFLLFHNPAYLTLCPDDIWLTAVHWESTEWTAFANFIITEKVTNYSGLAGNSTLRKSHSSNRQMTSNRNLWF